MTEYRSPDGHLNTQIRLDNKNAEILLKKIENAPPTVKELVASDFKVTLKKSLAPPVVV